MTAPSAIARGSVWTRRPDGAVVVVAHVGDTEVQLYKPTTKRLWWLARDAFVRRYGPAPTVTAGPDATPSAELAPIAHGTPAGHRQHSYRLDPTCKVPGCGWPGSRSRSGCAS